MAGYCTVSFFSLFFGRKSVSLLLLFGGLFFIPYLYYITYITYYLPRKVQTILLTVTRSHLPRLLVESCLIEIGVQEVIEMGVPCPCIEKWLFAIARRWQAYIRYQRRLRPTYAALTCKRSLSSAHVTKLHSYCKQHTLTTPI